MIHAAAEAVSVVAMGLVELVVEQITRAIHALLVALFGALVDAVGVP